MARIRSLKPEMWSSESVGRLSRNARLLLVELITQVDDDGRIRASSRGLASLLYPFDPDASRLIDAWLDELLSEGMFIRYVVDGATYGYLPKFKDHQKIDHPSKSKFPEFTEPLANPREASRILAPDQGSRIKDQDGSGSGIKDLFSEAIAPGPKPQRKTPESIGPEIATSDGPWRITVSVALKRMVAYGMTEAQLIDLLGRVAKHNASLPAGKLPGAAAMQSILHAWFAKHSSGCAATEVAPRAPRLAPDVYAAALAVQNEVFPRAIA